MCGLKHQKEKRSMTYFAGLDVSVKETSVCIVDDAGKIVQEARVASEPEALLQVLTNTIYRFKRVGLEAGPLSQWLYSVLAEAGLPVICVETRHMRAVLKAASVAALSPRSQSQHRLLGTSSYTRAASGLSASERPMTAGSTWTSRRRRWRRSLNLVSETRGSMMYGGDEFNRDQLPTPFGSCRQCSQSARRARPRRARWIFSPLRGLEKLDISILSDKFLAEVGDMPQRNLAVELLEKLLKGELKTRRRKNVVQARSFAEMLEQTLRRYQNRGIEAAQVIEELIALAKEMREANARGEALDLQNELAFYDALETNDSAVKVLGDETLRTTARELVATVRSNVTIDWTLRENVRAQLRVLVKRILRNHGYPPDKQEKATQTVLEQAALLSADWAA
jgi:Domain of unknown function (DUF3387)